MTKNSATGYKCTICTRSTHPITPVKQDTHTHRRAKLLSSGLFYYTTSHIFLSVCSTSSLLSQVMFRPVGSIGNLYLAKGSKEDYHRFFLSFWPPYPLNLYTVRWFATFALSYSFFSLCCGSSLPAPADGKGSGEDQNIRRQQKMWTSSCYVNALYENSALSARNFAVFSVLTSVSEPHWFQCGSGSSFLLQCGSRSGSETRIPPELNLLSIAPNFGSK